MKREQIIKMVNISKNFGAIEAVKNVDMELYQGEILALLGDNGAGKSTLMNILAGVFSPTKGTMFFKGKEVRFNSPADARKIGIETVYQDLSLFEDISIERNIFAGGEPTRPILGGLVRFLDKKKMEIVSKKELQNLKIDIDSTKRTVRRLSGGQRQTVAIARVLCFNASVMIMDEPTAALGIKQTDTTYKLVKSLREEKNISIILVSHNLEDVFAIADRLVVLKHGQKVLEKEIRNTSREEIRNKITEVKID